VRVYRINPYKQTNKQRKKERKKRCIENKKKKRFSVKSVEK